MERQQLALFQLQELRQYVESYNSISAAASIVTSRVTKDTATKGEITNPEGRRAPQTIEPWRQSDIDLERAIIDTLLQETDGGADSVLFPERQHVIHVGEDLVRVDSEHAVLLHDSDTLHKPATRILRSLLAVERIRTAIELSIQRHGRGKRGSLRPGKVSFPTHQNQVSYRTGTKRKREDASSASLRRLGPADVFCILELEKHARPRLHLSQSSSAEESIEVNTDSGLPELLFIKEAKAPHKLTADIIDKAIGNGGRTLDSSAIMNRGFSGSDLNWGLDVEECEYWFAAVCTQLYANMIDGVGLRYGIITTGIYYVFVFIDPENPSILRYRVSKTASDFNESPLLRLVALALLAMQNPKVPDGPELDLIQQGHGLIWATGTENPSFYNTGTPQTHETESWREASGQRSDGGGSPCTDPRMRNRGDLSGRSGTSVDATRPETRAQAHRCGASRSAYPSPPPHGATVLGKRERQDEVNERGNELEAAPTLLDTKRLKLEEKGETEAAATLSTELPPMPATPTSSPLASPASSEPVSIDDRPYCTTACLLALRRQDDSQPRCPNHAEHIRAASLITKPSELRQHLKDQLIKREGPRSEKFLLMKPGAGFAQPIKIWLKSHGHVLIAKAFQPEDVQTMRQEAQIYDRLRHLQGIDVPVCLGTIELPTEKSLLCWGVGFTGLLLLSFAGAGMDNWPCLGMGIGEAGEADRSFTQSLIAEVTKSLGRIHKKGVLHRDIALRNIMVKKITRYGSPSHPTFDLQVQLIDFERSRSRAGYRCNAARKMKGSKEGDADRSIEEIGNEDFARACANEMEHCSRAMAMWYGPDMDHGRRKEASLL